MSPEFFESISADFGYDNTFFHIMDVKLSESIRNALGQNLENLNVPLG
jgi:hypothetical protein